MTKHAQDAAADGARRARIVRGLAWVNLALALFNTRAVWQAGSWFNGIVGIVLALLAVGHERTAARAQRCGLELRQIILNEMETRLAQYFKRHL